MSASPCPSPEPSPPQTDVPPPHPDAPAGPGVRTCSWCPAPLPEGTTLSVEFAEQQWLADVCEDHVARQLRRIAAHLIRAGKAEVSYQRARRLGEHETLDHVRTWARAAGLPVSVQGALSVAVMQAYRSYRASGLHDGSER